MPASDSSDSRIRRHSNHPHALLAPGDLQEKMPGLALNLSDYADSDKGGAGFVPWPSSSEPGQTQPGRGVGARPDRELDELPVFELLEVAVACG